MRIQTVRKGVKIDPWAVAVFDPRCNDGGRIGDQLVESCCRRGMMMRRPAVVQKELPDALNRSPEQRVEWMLMSLKKYTPVFILVILSDKDSPIYGNLILSWSFTELCNLSKVEAVFHLRD